MTLSCAARRPVSVVIVDADRVDAFQPEVEDLVAEGLVMVDGVTVVRHVGRTA